ncbi:MAG TPA: DUF6159 family protein [Solirubrobacterales bacterium]|nr:DUF6159 family protein [Solirubrobacterales bacterium]
MEAQSQRESRLSRGWRLTVAAWQLMRQDPTMMALALIGTGCGLAGAVLMLYLGGVFSGDYSRSHFWVVSLAFVYPLTFLGAFFNVALTAAAAAALEGRWLGVAGSLREAVGRLRQIAVWSLLLVGVGFLINEIASRVPFLGGLVARLLGAAWNLGTIFAIPLLTLEDADPLEAVQGSARLVKSKWGEGLTGLVGIGAWTVVAMVPAAIIGVTGLAIAHNNPAAGIAIACLAGAGFIAIWAMANATRQVFGVALFRYATGAATPGFELRDLENPFEAKKGKGRRRTRKWAWIALGLIVGLVALAAIFGSNRHKGPEGPGFWYVSYGSGAASWVRDGMPVVYKGRRVGTVFEHWTEDNGVRIGYYVDPSLHVPVASTEPALTPGPHGPYVHLVSPAARSRIAGGGLRS